jgi:hypothetical protein
VFQNLRRTVVPVLTTVAILLGPVPALAGEVVPAAVPTGQPRNVTARPGDGLAVVSWEAPDPEDGTVTGYTVTAAPLDTAPVHVDASTFTATLTGLDNGVAYSFTVVTTNADGDGPPSDASALLTPSPPAPTTLSLRVTRSRVLAGGRLWLSGRLRDAQGAGLAGETVVVEQRRRGTSSWGTVATRTTGIGGQVTPVQVAARSHMHYRLRHPATPFHAASVSGPGVVLVGVRISSRVTSGRIRLGKTTSIRGNVSAAHDGQVVVLQRKVGRSWRTAQRIRATATGSYRFTLRPGTAGTSWWRAVDPGDADHLGAVSSMGRLVVIPKAKPKPKLKPRPKAKPKPKARPRPRNCDPSYPGVCLKVGIGDYDCAGGSGNGPNYVQGPITVRRPDPFGLDRDGNGVGCE